MRWGAELIGGAVNAGLQKQGPLLSTTLSSDLSRWFCSPLLQNWAFQLKNTTRQVQFN